MIHSHLYAQKKDKSYNELNLHIMKNLHPYYIGIHN
jgi:hypothetical protein